MKIIMLNIVIFIMFLQFKLEVTSSPIGDPSVVTSSSDSSSNPTTSQFNDDSIVKEVGFGLGITILVVFGLILIYGIYEGISLLLYEGISFDTRA